MIRSALAAATFTAALTFLRLRATPSTDDVLRATPYVGRQVLLQDYCSEDYFAEDYTGSWVWVPS